jgi:hypothetical protein
VKCCWQENVTDRVISGINLFTHVIAPRCSACEWRAQLQCVDHTVGRCSQKRSAEQSKLHCILLTQIAKLFNKTVLQESWWVIPTDKRRIICSENINSPSPIGLWFLGQVDYGKKTYFFVWSGQRFIRINFKLGLQNLAPYFECKNSWDGWYQVLRNDNEGYSAASISHASMRL